jgi:hypothetical protein
MLANVLSRGHALGVMSVTAVWSGAALSGATRLTVSRGARFPITPSIIWNVTRECHSADLALRSGGIAAFLSETREVAERTRVSLISCDLLSTTAEKGWRREWES